MLTLSNVFVTPERQRPAQLVLTGTSMATRGSGADVGLNPNGLVASRLNSQEPSRSPGTRRLPIGDLVGRPQTGHKRAESRGQHDIVFAFECIDDMSDPVSAEMRRLAGDDSIVVVMDERVGETFSAPGDEVERVMYGYSLMCCLTDCMSHQPSAGTGTVMRPPTLATYAQQAGFDRVDILPIDNDFFRFYRLVA